jgi:hypothetical protein
MRGRTCARRPGTVQTQGSVAPRRAADVAVVALITPRRIPVVVARIQAGSGTDFRWPNAGASCSCACVLVYPHACAGGYVS